MKRKRFSLFLILLSVLTLLFSGCNFDGNIRINTDGTVIEYNTDDIIINDTEQSQIDDSDEIIEDETSDVSGEEIESEEAGDDTDAEDADAEDVSDDKDNDAADTDASNDDADELTVNEDGEYTSKDEVALYIHLYNHLPSNFITKNEAKDLGWDSSKGNLHKVAPGKSIGGDKFGNREGLLPKKDGRVYYECDIDYKKGSRNAKRIVFSNDGLIYYTEDHYETYELLYE